VRVLVKHLQEEIAPLRLNKIGVKLTKRPQEQTDRIGVNPGGSDKPGTHRIAEPQF